MPRQFERFAPGTRERIVALVARFVPATEAYDPDHMGGDIINGSTGALPLVPRPRPTPFDPYATGVPGVHLCSAATPARCRDARDVRPRGGPCRTAGGIPAPRTPYAPRTAATTAGRERGTAAAPGAEGGDR